MVRRFQLYLVIIFICCGCFHGVCSASDTDFQAILKRLEHLENKEKIYDEIISDLQGQNDAQASAIGRLQQELDTKDATIGSLTRTMTSVNEAMVALTNRVSILEAEREYIKNGNENQLMKEHFKDHINESEVADAQDTADVNAHEGVTQFGKHHIGLPAKRLIVDPEIPVAFHAVVSVDNINHVGNHQNIAFDKVLLNLGAGYHNQHGVFIAPTNGLYLFSTTIMSYVDPVSEFKAEIVKNGNLLGRVFTHGDSGREDQSAMTVLVQLATNDEVWVRQVAGTRMYGYYFSSFAGVLLMPQ